MKIAGAHSGDARRKRQAANSSSRSMGRRDRGQEGREARLIIAARPRRDQLVERPAELPDGELGLADPGQRRTISASART
jgi:hypothetical protein